MCVSWYVCKSQRTSYCHCMGPGVKLMASSLAAASLRAEPFLQADKYSLILRRGVKFHPSTVKINGRKEGGSYLLFPTL